MPNSCNRAIEEVFKDDPGPMSVEQVIQALYDRYPEKPWKPNTIRHNLIGLSVNHSSGKHHPNLQKRAFLFYQENGQYRRSNAGEAHKQDGRAEINGQSEFKSIDQTEFEANLEENESDSDKKGVGKQNVNERQWMTNILMLINEEFQKRGYKNYVASQGKKLTYAFEILSYSENGSNQNLGTAYETDILVYEKLGSDVWKPRVVIEGKLGRVTTHDAITYSQKALTHKNVHPYLRYGILLGYRKHYPLPGRLYRHGAYFDFMLSCQSIKPSDQELENLINLLLEEIQASMNLEEIFYNSRNPNRKRFTQLHRPLILK